MFNKTEQQDKAAPDSLLNTKDLDQPWSRIAHQRKSNILFV